MLVWTTCRLIVASKAAWQSLAAATEPDVLSVESGRRCAVAGGLRLPSPALHGAAVGGVAALVAALGASLHGRADFALVLRHALAAIGAGVGATAAALLLVPTLLPTNYGAHFPRYASVTSLPLAAAGLASLLPQPTLSIIAIAALGLIAYRSGSLGARVFLNLQGSEITRAAAVTAVVSTLPGLLLVPLCAAR